jgi:hypothetical protein
MKFEANWRQKSIENLEKNNWGEVPQDESSIVRRLMKLRKIPLSQFTIDDVRFMIIQETGLPFLLRLAIEILQNDLFAEGNYYEGDLLNSVFKIKPENWKLNYDYWLEIDELIKNRLDELRNYSPKMDLANFYSAKRK